MAPWPRFPPLSGMMGRVAAGGEPPASPHPAWCPSAPQNLSLLPHPVCAPTPNFIKGFMKCIPSAVISTLFPPPFPPHIPAAYTFGERGEKRGRFCCSWRVGVGRLQRPGANASPSLGLSCPPWEPGVQGIDSGRHSWAAGEGPWLAVSCWSWPCPGEQLGLS